MTGHAFVCQAMPARHELLPNDSCHDALRKVYHQAAVLEAAMLKNNSNTICNIKSSIVCTSISYKPSVPSEEVRQ